MCSGILIKIGYYMYIVVVSVYLFGDKQQTFQLGSCQVTFHSYLNVQSARQLNILTNQTVTLSVYSVVIPIHKI